jgi:hypothetical protein
MRHGCCPAGRWDGGLPERCGNVFPEGYPLDDWPLAELIRGEGRLARALDYGIISSRLAEL